MPVSESLTTAHPAQAADIPSVDRLLRAPALQELLARHGRTAVTAALRAQLAQLRQCAIAGQLEQRSLTDAAIAAALGPQLALAARPALKPVFNLSGTVLHTNLGRALLPPEAARAIAQVASAPVNLEFAASATHSSSATSASSRVQRRPWWSTTTRPRCCCC
jgi:L-seryl-tRNA(Ser) seleniumtransferase